MSQGETQVKLAIERTEMALERTQLAWVRTTFAIISAGLALDKGIQALHDANVLANKDWLIGGHLGGVFLSSLATVSLLWATIRLQKQAEGIDAGAPVRSAINPAVMLSAVVILLGVAVVCGLMVLG